MTTSPTSRIVHVTDQSFQQIIKTQPGLVLVDFYADRCGPCRMIAPVMEELAAKYGEKITVVKVNVDECQVTAIQAGVTSIPDVRIYKGGTPVWQQRWAGPASMYQSVIDQLLLEENKAARTA